MLLTEDMSALFFGMYSVVVAGFLNLDMSVVRLCCMHLDAPQHPET